MLSVSTLASPAGLLVVEHPGEHLVSVLNDSVAASSQEISASMARSGEEARDDGGENAGVDRIQDKLRHLELDFVEVIGQTRENIEELHFWRFVQHISTQTET
jgi:hypothetical protein